MKQKDYYAILGVTRAESAGGIRAAYRKLARIHHPDHAGPGRTRRFQEINEAYRVLSDPAARKSYNESLTREEERLRAQAAPGESVSPRRTQARPTLIRGLSEQYGSEQYGQEGFFARIFGSLYGTGFAETAFQRPIKIEVILSRAEARKGGFLPLAAPSSFACSNCMGTGSQGMHLCTECGGRGAGQYEENITIRIPPGVRDGTTLDIPSRHTRPRILVHIFVR